MEGYWKKARKIKKELDRLNVSKIAQYGKNNEIILVPGKVLGIGNIEKSVKVAAFSFSNSAYEKLLKSGSEAMTIGELLKENPDVKNIRILG